jgi:hypothetical protein
MSLERLRLVDVHDKEEELLLQEIVNSKLSVLPPQGEAFRGDVPDIKTPEQEAEWQAKIDQRNTEIKDRYSPAPDSTVGAPNTDIPSTTAEEPKPTETPVELPILGEVPGPTEEIKKFCDQCDSKGGIHKKGCPNKAI